MIIPFKQMQVGGNFWVNGTWYRKRSNRTAEIIHPEQHQGLWFYFSTKEPVQVKPC